MEHTSPSAIRTFWAALRGIRDLVKRHAQQYQAQQIKAQSLQGVESWMALEDTSTRCINGGLHELSLQGVVNPLTDTQKQKAEAQQQGMNIGNAFYLYRQANNNARCAKCDKKVVPVLHLQPGVQFVSHSASPVDQKSI
jgi:hypothetical protein